MYFLIASHLEIIYIAPLLMQVFAAAYQLAFITIVLVPLSLLLKDAHFAAIARIFGISVGIVGMLFDFSHL
jgi:hypothetical protein